MTENNQSKNQSLLDAAGTLFAETGYGQIDVETIAHKADVDPSFIYSEYNDKAGFCYAWLVSLHQHLLYSAATIEAKNLETVWPIERAREIALEVSKAARNGQRLKVTQTAS